MTLALTVLTTATAWAQEGLTYNTAGDTCTIHNATGWNAFCILLENNAKGYFAGKTVVLGADITINRAAGQDRKDFTGTFDGGGHTITLAFGTDEEHPYKEHAAVFRNTEYGAKIQNLNVKGTVAPGGSRCYVGGLAGVNAGGFVDNNGLSNGSVPLGLVVRDGTILFGDAYTRYNIVGLDGEGKLLVGTMTAQDALDQGMKYGVSFVTHDGIASSLIINGEIQTQNLGVGVNPRTAIGQREDGALLLLVLDGRSSKTLGATVENVVDIMLQYGAINAGNLDGGSSSVMVYDGEIINNCASVTGPRSIPTGFIVLGEEDGANG